MKSRHNEQTHALEEPSQSSEVTDELFSPRANFMPYLIQLLPDDEIERLEVRIFDFQIIEIQLSSW